MANKINTLDIAIGMIVSSAWIACGLGGIPYAEYPVGIMTALIVMAWYIDRAKDTRSER